MQISQPTLRVSDILADRTILRTLNLPQGMVNTLWNLNLSPSSEGDQMVWTREGRGHFSVKSAWELVRSRRTVTLWGKGIWDQFLPTKISFFLWRMLWNRLPTDDRIVGMGFQMPSQCCCCAFNCQSENIKHLLFDGEWARYHWIWLVNNFQMGQLSGRNWDQWLEFMFKPKNKESFVEKL